MRPNSAAGGFPPRKPNASRKINFRSSSAPSLVPKADRSAADLVTYAQIPRPASAAEGSRFASNQGQLDVRIQLEPEPLKYSFKENRLARSHSAGSVGGRVLRSENQDWCESSSRQGPALLIGLSPNAAKINKLTGSRLNVLALETFRQSDIMQQTFTYSNFRKGMADEDFAATIDSMSSTIENFKLGAQAFAGKPGNTRAATGNGANDAKPGFEEEDETERKRLQAKRFAAYKMCRKIERGIPPLDRSILAEKPYAPVRDQTLVKWNATHEALLRYRPEYKRDMVKVGLERLARRSAKADIMRKQALLHEEERISTNISRKNERTILAVAAKKRGFARERASDPCEMMTIWIVMMVCVSIAEEIQEILATHKLDIQQRLSRLDAQPEKPRRCSIARRNSSVFKNRDFTSLQSIEMMIWAKIQLRRRRVAARVAYHNLVRWKYGGRAFIFCKKLSKSIRNLQRWWRECMEKLKEVRLAVLDRWEVIERLDFERRRRQDAPNVLPLTREVRINFIRRELMARRYRVLPRLEIWEDEQKVWAKKLVDNFSLVEHYERRGTNIPTRAISNFQFRFPPPSKPSHLPPRHPNHGMRDRMCPMDCPGRQGDLEILDMIWRAFKFPDGSGGWEEVQSPFACRRVVFRETKHHKRPRDPGAAGSSENSEVESLPATNSSDHSDDEDLRFWGVSTAALPGLVRSNASVVSNDA